MQESHWRSLRTINGKQLYFRYKWVKCYHPRCNKCPHGPYLYKRYWAKKRRKFKRIWEYIGKIGSEKEQYELTLEIQAERERERVAMTI